jgi:hypothetical protein
MVGLTACQSVLFLQVSQSLVVSRLYTVPIGLRQIRVLISPCLCGNALFKLCLDSINVNVCIESAQRVHVKLGANRAEEAISKPIRAFSLHASGG